MLRFFPLRLLALAAAAATLAGCAGDREHQLVISVPEQRLLLLKNGQPLATYPVSTSKFGLGDRPGGNGTPLGEMHIAEKIGGGLPAGAVLKHREPTGEILAPDAPGRDPIVSRILWLKGDELGNRHAFDRYIYIHGTPEERNVGQPVSYGCVRMKSRDVIALFDEIGTGARVYIRDTSLTAAAAPYLVAPPPAASTPAPTLVAATAPTTASGASSAAPPAPPSSRQ
ncbi:MAG: L,D-transpeptidase [Verrucomicrobia bacterium]|nr:L,D-transpeptidase [Verrucomicrobiota bacterium]